MPENVVTNDDLAKIVDTNDEWIQQRTGIRERRISRDDQSVSSFAIPAAQEALTQAGLEASDLDMIVMGTVSSDYAWPAAACVLQEAIGATRAGAFDLSAACAGFVYGVSVASAMIEAGHLRHALVVGADCLSKQVDWTDRSTCVLFGDAAGAVVLSGEMDSDRGVICTVVGSDGSGAKHLLVEGGGSKYPHGAEHSAGRNFTISMAGSEVYRFAVNAMAESCLAVLEKAGVKPSDVDLFVPHQANIRIIDSAAKKLDLSSEKVFVNVDRYGNTSGGSIPLALYEAQKEGRLKPGMLVLTVGFGAGLVWGANLIRW